MTAQATVDAVDCGLAHCARMTQFVVTGGLSTTRQDDVRRRWTLTLLFVNERDNLLFLNRLRYHQILLRERERDIVKSLKV